MIIIPTSTLLSKVDPPNYDFSLDELALFMPGSPLSKIEEKYGKAPPYEKTGKSEIYRFYVKQIRYVFPVFVQVIEGKSVDFYAKLPSYFLHDIFHQSLINRLGKQDKYIKKERHALYIWNNKNNLKHTYHGACTITCFPIYYSAHTLNQELKFTPLLEQFRNKANF